MAYFEIDKKGELLEELNTVVEHLKHYTNNRAQHIDIHKILELRSCKEAIVDSLLTLLTREVTTFNNSKKGLYGRY